MLGSCGGSDGGTGWEAFEDADVGHGLGEFFPCFEVGFELFFAFGGEVVVFAVAA